MTAITKTTLFSEPWKTIRNLLKNNLSDPKSRFKKDIVFAAVPDTSKADFVGYPFVVVSPLKLDQEDRAFDADAKSYLWDGDITVYSLDDPNALDSLSDQVVKVVNQNHSTFNSDGLFSVRLDAVDTDQIVFGGNRVFTRTFAISFKRKIGTV